MIGHGVFALFGFYLIRNHVVEIDKKQITIVSIMLGFFVALVITLNLIFDTSFFGLNFNGKHNIYYAVITSSSLLSNSLYIFGLIALVILGSLLAKYLQVTFKKEEEQC